MAGADPGLFEPRAWRPALDKYGAATDLTVVVFDRGGRPVCGPTPSSPLHAALSENGVEPGLFRECARRCLAQVASRPAVIVAPTSGLAVVGASLVVGDEIVGAAVAGYALVDFPQPTAIDRLARQSGIQFARLWQVARRQQPMPRRRLVLHGELLQVLGDTLLREGQRTREVTETAARLAKEVAAKDEFMAVLSHELRTPLTPILTWARILRETEDLPPRVAKAMDSIERNAKLEVKLVDDLLDLNRIVLDKVTLDLAVHDVGELVRSALERVAAAAEERSIELAVELPTEPLAVEGDAGRLQQVLVNVLGNAIKYTPAGGHVRVSAAAEDGAAVVRIADDGEGIAADFLPHVFDMFRQQEEGTRRRHSGLGIGLALVKRLVALHGGETAIASDGPGRGTEVTLRLPPATAQETGAADSAPAPRVNGRPFAGLTILLVEDTEDTAEATTVRLELLGARVLAARDGVEALAVLATSDPDLVLCDLRMPRMDGFELLREVDRAHGGNHPPFIALSGLVGDAEHRRTRDAGFLGHLDKPFDDAALIGAVQATLGQPPAAV